MHGGAAVVAQAVIDVVHALADVDVEAGEAVVGLDHLVESLVREREQGMPAEHGGDHVGVLPGGPARELGVLGDGLIALLLAVAVGGLVAEAGAHARLLRDVLNREERPGNLEEAGVVVEDGGHAVADAVQDGRVRGGAGALRVEVAIDLPPLLLEVLEEVGGVAALDGQAAGEAGIDVGVGVDESRHDHRATRVEELCVGVLALERGPVADLHDLGAVDDDRAVLEVRMRLVTSDDPTICYEQHETPPPAERRRSATAGYL